MSVRFLASFPTRTFADVPLTVVSSDGREACLRVCPVRLGYVRHHVQKRRVWLLASPARSYLGGGIHGPGGRRGRLVAWGWHLLRLWLVLPSAPLAFLTKYSVAIAQCGGPVFQGYIVVRYR